jgi:hypothetical protein
MSNIGGYWELELAKGEEYHKNAIRLNTARNAFEYVLKTKGYKKVYLPYYTCEVMLEPLEKLALKYEYYHIDNNLKPIFDFKIIERSDAFVYTNYFGICSNNAFEISKVCKNLLIDNSQAFFAKPLDKVDTFYSARKYFGVSDGSYLYTDKIIDEELEQDISYNRFEHLLGRLDIGPEQFYDTFVKNDDSLKYQPIKLMSNLTRKILESVNYMQVSKIRRDNFNFLHHSFKDINRLKFTLDQESVPFIYPLLVDNGASLKRKLINQKIFVPTYWPNVFDWCRKDSYEYYLAENLVHIPIDQRYDSKSFDFLDILK